MRSPFQLFSILLLVLIAPTKLSAQTISYSDLYTSSTFTKTIDVSKPVGSVDGAAGTSPTGAATYTIPIKCPPGTNGMVPNLSIVYNSQGGNGILGQGWNLSGLSAITRAGKDNYHHSKTTPIKYDNTDVFVLDGAYLYSKTGTYGAGGATYKTESESYSVTTSTGTFGDGPDYFTVVSKDGTTMEYGRSATSKFYTDDLTKVMIWRISKIIDVNGNYMEFVYDNSDRDSRISQVKYTGNISGLAPYNEVNFHYQIRSDLNTVYDGGYSAKSKYLLWQIEVKSEGDVYSKYQFNYGKNNSSTFLKGIYAASGDGSVLNDTRFKYGDETTDEVKSNYSGLLGTYPTPDDCISPADFDGDGLDDLLVSKKSWDHSAAETWTSSFTIKKRTSASSAYSDISTITFPSSSVVFENDKFMQKSYLGSSADFNGDGRSDIIVSNSNILTDRVLNSVQVYYANSSGGVSSSPDYTYYPLSLHKTIFKTSEGKQNYFYMGDFNGDGLSDFITILNGRLFYNSPSTGVENKMANDFTTSSGLVDVPLAVSRYFWHADGVYVVNIDGDSKSDLMIVEGNVTRLFTLDFDVVPFFLHVRQIGGDLTYPNKDNEILLGDFNGDGKSDILTGPKKSLSIATKDWKIGYSNGINFSVENFTFDHPIKFDYGADMDRLCVGDFNGDGKSDIYSISYATPKEHHLYYSGGTVFNLKKISATVSSIADELISGDFNGDGKSDLFANKSVELVSFNPFGKSKIIEKVTDGFNRTTEFAYEPLTKGTGTGSGDFYTKGSGESYPLNNGQYSMYVVTSMSMPNGIGGVNAVNYKYDDLRLHRGGRGLLGFKKIKTINITNDLRTESIFDLDDKSLYVPYLKTSKTYLHSVDDLLSQSDYTFQFTLIGSDKCYKQESINSVVQDIKLGVSTTTSNTFDADGNVTYSTSTTTGGETFTSTSTNTYIATGGSTFLNRPSLSVTTSKRGSQPTVSTEQTFTYNAKGLPVSSVTKPSGGIYSTELTETMGYDAYGNLNHKTTHQHYSATIPYTHYEYDDYGRFVKTEENTFGDKTYYTTHKFWGKPLTVKGVNGLTTTYTYDAWGKLSTANIPTGSGTSYTINYSDGWDIGTHQLYYTLVQDPSAPDVKTWYDYLGRQVKTSKETFGGAWTSAYTSYNAKGNVQSSTNFHVATESPLSTTNTYDEYNRIKSTSSVSGTTEYEYVLGGGYTNTTVKLPDGTIKKTKADAIGKIIESSNGNAGTVVFDYDSRGNEISNKLKGAFGPITTKITKKYDDFGFLNEMDDLDAGKFGYAYDRRGRIISALSPNSVHTGYVYDKADRLVEKNITKGSVQYKYEYKYFGADKDYRPMEVKVTGPDGIVTEYFDYNVGGGLSTYIKDIKGTVFAKSYTYDAYNRPLSSTDNTHLVLPSTGSIFYCAGSGFGTVNQYDANGFLTKISSNTTPAKTLYEATAMNGSGQITAFKRPGGLSSYIDYTNNIPTYFSTSGIQDLTMNYDYRNGNVLSRTEGTVTPPVPEESFAYDAIDRLTKSDVAVTISGTTGPVTLHSIVNTGYDKFMTVGTGPTSYGTLSYGRIVSKSDVGTYSYSGFPANAVKEIIIAPGSTVISHETQNIEYNLFDKTQTITEKIGGIDYEEKMVYDAAEDRTYTQQSQGSSPTAMSVTRQRWYVGDYEKQTIAGSDQHIHYISSDAGLVAMVVKDAAGYHYYAAFTDHLGSIVKVTDELGITVAEQNYDAWGRERNPASWDYDMTGTFAKPTWLYRGYTGHEMLPEYGLINMNGRIYDPANGRMLRPDNYVTYPDNTQSYNRYSYAMNNPLKYTDPDGNMPQIAAAMIIGGLINGALYTARAEKWDWAQFTYAVGTGAIGGALGFGIGNAFTPAANISTGGLILNEAARAGAHGISGYIMSSGSMSGFYSGALSSLAGSFSTNVKGVVGEALNTTLGGTIFAAGVGGGASAISRGNFWQGAAIGATVHLVNQGMHKYQPPPKDGLPGFPGSGKGSYNPESKRWRWRLPNGDIGEWDSRHGEVEVYDKSGNKHKGGFDPKTGEQISGAKKGRTTFSDINSLNGVQMLNRFEQLINRPVSTPTLMPLPVPSLIPFIQGFEEFVLPNRYSPERL